MKHKYQLTLNSFLAVILSIANLVTLTGAEAASTQRKSALPGSLQRADPLPTDPNSRMGNGPEVSMQLAVPVYSVQDLGTLGGGSTYARAINNAGKVTGWSNLGTGLMYERAFQWQNGLMQALPVLGGNPALSIGHSVNTAGQVAGYSSASGSTARAVLWSGSSVSDLGTLGGRNAAALHVNDSGQMVGWSEFDPDSGERRAVIWSGGISALAAGGNFDEALSINNAGTAAGECITIGTSTVTRPCAWPGGVLAVLAVLGGIQGSARDINEAGTIVGWAETSEANHLGGKIPHAALWDAGGVHDLGALPGNKVSRANAINTQGLVVGAASIAGDLASSPTHAVLWENDQIYDLNDRIPAGAGWVLTEAYGINDTGQIVGVGGHDGVYYRAFLLTPVTQPVVTLDGPGAGLKGQPYTYTATSGPDSLELPIAYTWMATDQTDFSESGGLTSTHEWNWADTGSKVVNVTATSTLGTATASHLIDIGDVLVQPVSGSSTEIQHTFAPERTITISIPPDAVPTGTELLFTALSQPSETTGYTFAGISFKLDAYVAGERQPGFVFSQPVTVTMSFAAGDLTGLDESAIILYYQAGSAWIDAASTCQPASPYVRNPAQHTLSVGICHLSTFATWVFDGSRIFLPVIRKN